MFSFSPLSFLPITLLFSKCSTSKGQSCKTNTLKIKTQIENWGRGRDMTQTTHPTQLYIVLDRQKKKKKVFFCFKSCERETTQIVNRATWLISCLAVVLYNVLWTRKTTWPYSEIALEERKKRKKKK